MSTAGPNSAGTITGAGWTNPTNAATTNAIYATQSVAALSPSTDLVFSVYGFSIPTSATINGIQVDIVRHASGTASIDISGALGSSAMSISKTVGVAAAAKTSTVKWGVGDATESFGGPADLWGITWTPADINATGFGVVFGCDNNNPTLARTASVDSILITVTYTLPAASQMLKMF